jgi:hypothetical protein
MMAPPLRTAGGSVAVPGTADVETRWDLMMALPDFSHGVCNSCAIPFDPTRPLSEWKVAQTFPTEQECLDHRPGNVEDFQCVATDDPRLKEKQFNVKVRTAGPKEINKLIRLLQLQKEVMQEDDGQE